jgi:serine protease Do
MANPYVSNAAIDKPTAALGSLTRVRFQGPRPLRGIPRSDSYYKFGTLLEHDAKLNAGVTGAALLNLDGEMIGLSTTTAAIGAGDSSAGYAIPMDVHVRRIIDVLRRGEEVEYGFLGVIMDDGRAGIGIDRVTPLGPAARAGIDGGDVVTHINGTRVNTYEDLLVHIGSALAGSKIKLTVSRFGRTRDVEVTLAKFKHEQPFIASVRPEPVFGLRVDYSSILAQQQNTDPRAGLRGVPAGVSVREVLPNSPAAAAFKKLGDSPTRWLITHVNGDEVTTPAEFYKAAKGQKSLKLTVIDPSVVDPPAREVSLP